METELQKYAGESVSETTGSDFKVFGNEAYFQALEELIPQANRRVWLQTMHIHSHEPTTLVRDLLLEAAARDVDTRFTVDSYYRLFLDGSLYYMPHLSPKKRQKMRAAKRDKDSIILSPLRENNVQVLVTNPPRTLTEKLNPASGRNHNKMAIIDDTAFVGDINIVGGRSSPGIMIQVSDPTLVEGLAFIYETAQKGRGGEDYEIVGRNNTSLLVDTGVPGRSLILDRAISAITDAQRSITLTSQFTPDGPIVEALNQARAKGKEVSVVTSSSEAIDRYWQSIFNRWNQLKLRRMGVDLPLVEVPTWIHSKVLLLDEDFPTQKVIAGTHCFSGKGVDWGTQEISLESRDTGLIAQLRDHVDSFVQNIKVAA